jgi:hypothetical protein
MRWVIIVLRAASTRTRPEQVNSAVVVVVPVVVVVLVVVDMVVVVVPVVVVVVEVGVVVVVTVLPVYVVVVAVLVVAVLVVVVHGVRPEQNSLAVLSCDAVSTYLESAEMSTPNNTLVWPLI